MREIFNSVDLAIEHSVLNTCIARVVSTPQTREQLALVCDDSSESADEIEFWGETDNGDPWRVHCVNGLVT